MTRVVFVDGSSGVGKGYFIDNLVTSLEKNNKTVKVFRAADYALASAKEEERKYTFYETEEAKLEGIFQGHLKLVEDIKEALNDRDVVLVDRSILSYIVYNLHGKSLTYLCKVLERYVRFLNKMIRKQDMLLVCIDVDGMNVEDRVKIIKKRLEERNDNKEIDEEWLAYSNEKYRQTAVRVCGVFHNTFLLTSDDYEIITKVLKND